MIITRDGHCAPINIIRGLPYIQMEPNMTKEFNTLPHIVLTQGGEWDPKVLDYMLTDQDDWMNIVKRDGDPVYKSPFDERGEYLHTQPPKLSPEIESAGIPKSE